MRAATTIFKDFHGGAYSESSSKEDGFAGHARPSRFATCKFIHLEKKIVPSSQSNPGCAPFHTCDMYMRYFIHITW